MRYEGGQISDEGLGVMDEGRRVSDEEGEVRGAMRMDEELCMKEDG